VIVIPKTIYDEWNGKYDITKYVFVNTDNNEPYWAWNEKPAGVTIVNLAASPPNANNNNNPYWTDALKVRVLPKLEWFVISKTFPVDEYEFFSRGDGN
jgi:hypothetical protein